MRELCTWLCYAVVRHQIKFTYILDYFIGVGAIVQLGQLYNCPTACQINLQDIGNVSYESKTMDDTTKKTNKAQQNQMHI